MEITPRGFGDVLSLGMTVLGRVWRSLVTPALGMFIPLGALTLVTFSATGGDVFFRLVFSDPGALESMPPEDFARMTTPFVEAVLISLTLQLVATGFVHLAAHRIVKAHFDGVPISGGAASAFAASRMLILIPALALGGLAIGLGMFLLVIPGVWLFIALSMTSEAVALEGAGVVQSLVRSTRLVRGRWWQTAGYVVLVGLLGSVAGQLIQLVAVPLLAVGDVSTALALAFVMGTIIQGLVVAAIAVMNTVWYFDLRARSEMVAGGGTTGAIP